ncbi:uncharacterized protein HD556DRAFT_1310761 [Suillus plorans]|uniref:Uncharacterized protein n=1 Tax=Suillus plorans TaxID=116603 RepID=A0A9P7DF75_9AGAM|nr:uncharacterized protein HD556DRAFT_1310761 [Suillus plorans]KAG1790154.1 hypothetical protein HD556DRAFT_1310761 [Suillus plorans]
MPISGVLVNVHDPDYVLATAKDGAHVKVEGQGFNHTDNQRWLAKYTYDRKSDSRLWSVQNKDTGNYLSWNSSMQVLMSDTEHWWKLVFVGENIALQVPHASKDDDSYYTLELEDNASVTWPVDRGIVTLKNQTGTVISRQLWTPVDK